MRLSAFIGAVLLASCVAAQPPLPERPAAATASSDEIFYHIFTRSMRDSNGDAQGDLRGITDSLDYLKELGVTSILLTPLYPSYFYHNYFATDFEGIDPEYGTMDDFRRLVAEVHRRGMKIYLDQEIQYVADDHEWWADPVRDPASRWSQYILWDDRAANIAAEGPFGLREAANFSGRTTGIATVNMKSPEVKAYFSRFFLNLIDPDRNGDFSDGVDGFRIDHMMDDLDGKGILTNLFEDFWRPLFAKVRAVNPKVRFIAEQSDWGYGGDFLSRGDTDYAFAFPLGAAIRSFDKQKIVEALAGTAAATPQGKEQLIFVENHDMNRIGSDDGITPAKLRTAAALTVLLKGVPILYYGQEIGMRGRVDPSFKTDEREIGAREAFEWTADGKGNPHAFWYAGPKSYWTNRYAQPNDGISVEEQAGAPGSLLSYYKRLIALRRSRPEIAAGAQSVLDGPPGVLMVERRLGKRGVVLVVNLTESAVPAPAAFRDKKDLLGNARPVAAIQPFVPAVFAAR